ncbi:MAG: hypothetical protein KJ964_14570 [Verrucomicrobia bacterium]|nr:hypothetical protein [Verrucomicrobiota bacterium]MBU1733871.1 hypothetical protein [Verrucomicrobiota bacterium]MBU1856303.1 hypothetical protein [Verrucomicrobiota bacterium]
MLFGKKKNNVIDRRIKELRKEMERVRGEMKTASRPGAAQPPVSTPRISATSGPVFGAKPPLGRTENDLFAHAARQSEAGKVEATGRPFAGDSDYPALFDQPDTNPQTVRKKFANYFMAGHFQNLRPLRQESRIVRNKAIVMVILVLALILWLVYYLQTH